MSGIERLTKARLIAEAGRSSTVKARYIAEGQQLLRTDDETTEAISDETARCVITAIRAELLTADVMILSDYMKGVLSDDVLAVAIADRVAIAVARAIAIAVSIARVAVAITIAVSIARVAGDLRIDVVLRVLVGTAPHEQQRKPSRCRNPRPPSRVLHGASIALRDG